MGNVSIQNHIIHFIIGIISNKVPSLTALFLVYQLIDGFKFKYKVVRTGRTTDDIPMDLLFFSLGELFMRAVTKIDI